MFALIKRLIKKNKNQIIEYIRIYVYPEKDYPPTKFPDIHFLVYNSLLKNCEKIPDLKRNLIKNSGSLDLKSLFEILKLENLIKFDPHTVVLIYKKYIEIFVAMKISNYQLQKEYVQEIISELLKRKIFIIRRNFKFHNIEAHSFTIYFLVVVQNLIIENQRKKKYEPVIDKYRNGIDLYFDDQSAAKLKIKEEIQKLESILRLYYRLAPQMELILKLKYQLIITNDLLQKVFPKLPKTEIKSLIENNLKNKDDELFEKIVHLLVPHGKKSSTFDSKRRWIDRNIKELIEKMNKFHNDTTYGIKNFGVLVEYYFENQRGNIY